MTKQDGTQAHATLSPSAAKRWISCPASIRVEQEILLQQAEAEPSAYALEGTAAHALAELRARHEMLLSVPETEFRAALAEWRQSYQISSETEREMFHYTDLYLDLLRQRMTLYPHTQLLLEQRMPTGIPGCWGTSDAVLVSPQHVEIVDLKYGQGVMVWADDPQLRLYGIGALETYGDLLGDAEIVRLTVFQPRLEHESVFELQADELRAWRDSIIPIAELALSEDAPFGPSEDACRWCEASGRCRAQMEWATQRDFGSVDLLTPEEMAELLPMLGGIEQFCSDLRRQALELAYSLGTPIPGHKVVMSGSKRYVTDSDKAIGILTAAGYDPDDVSSRKVAGIGVLEKLLGKEQFADILGPVVDKTPGRPSLVSEDDPRPAISSLGEASKDFSDG